MTPTTEFVALVAQVVAVGMVVGLLVAAMAVDDVPPAPPRDDDPGTYDRHGRVGRGR